jgi:hypothetical protein
VIVPYESRGYAGTAEQALKLSGARKLTVGGDYFLGPEDSYDAR